MLLSELPVEITKQLSNLEVMEKQTVMFECEVSKPNQVAIWFQGADKIEPGVGDWERFRVEVDGHIHRLIIENVHLEDAKKYSCTIKDKKTSATLSVKGMCLLDLIC